MSGWDNIHAFASLKAAAPFNPDLTGNAYFVQFTRVLLAVYEGSKRAATRKVWEELNPACGHMMPDDLALGVGVQLVSVLSGTRHGQENFDYAIEDFLTLISEHYDGWRMHDRAYDPVAVVAELLKDAGRSTPAWKRQGTKRRRSSSDSNSGESDDDADDEVVAGDYHDVAGSDVDVTANGDDDDSA